MDKLSEPFRKAIPPLTSRVLESTVRWQGMTGQNAEHQHLQIGLHLATPDTSQQDLQEDA